MGGVLQNVLSLGWKTFEIFLQNLGPEALCDFAGAVGRVTVQQNDLIGPGHRPQAPAYVVGSILGEQGD